LNDTPLRLWNIVAGTIQIEAGGQVDIRIFFWGDE
jgi:hypothetical protein